MQLVVFSIYFILSQNCQVETVILILQMRKLRLRIMKRLAPTTQFGKSGGEFSSGQPEF